MRCWRIAAGGGCANVLPGVTGAWEAAVLGKLSLPPQRGAGTAFGCKSTE